MSVAQDSWREAARRWLEVDPDPATRRELEGLLQAGDDAGIEERFAHPLRFGTAGLRAELGAGPARMNRLVVRRTTAALATWLTARGEAGGGLVVGRDARHGSDAFAADAAAVAARFGVAVHALHRALPTPITAFAVRHSGAAAGVMITASHNPPHDNGYKLYLSDGAQVIPPYDAEVAAAADVVDLDPSPPPGTAPAPLTHPFGDGDEQLLEAYRRMALALVDPEGPRELTVVYTPLHGVGGAVLPGLLAAAGFADVRPVATQAAPDPDFPTVRFPNPEEPGTLDLALASARRSGADVMIANDPDADRLAVAVPDGSDWRVLSGNELGILLADHLLAVSTGEPRLVATSLASSRMLAALAADAGVAYEETPTGFKWIARAGRRHPGHRLVLGYEEALGYAVSEAVADKDGMTAALVVAEMAARDRAEGRSMLERLDALHARLGVHLTTQWSIRADGEDGGEGEDTEAGMARLSGLIAAWRGDPPTAFAGRPVTEVVDLAAGYRGYPPTDGMILELGRGEGRLVLRPSGTEPKLKLYLEAITPPPGLDGLAAARDHATAALDALRGDVAAALDAGLRAARRP